MITRKTKARRAEVTREEQVFFPSNGPARPWPVSPHSLHRDRHGDRGLRRLTRHWQCEPELRAVVRLNRDQLEIRRNRARSTQAFRVRPRRSGQTTQSDSGPDSAGPGLGDRRENKFEPGVEHRDRGTP
jgi:hypothetical protein